MHLLCWVWNHCWYYLCRCDDWWRVLKGKGKFRREHVNSFIALNNLCPLHTSRCLDIDLQLVSISSRECVLLYSFWITGSSRERKILRHALASGYPSLASWHGFSSQIQHQLGLPSISINGRFSWNITLIVALIDCSFGKMSRTF